MRLPDELVSLHKDVVSDGYALMSDRIFDEQITKILNRVWILLESDNPEITMKWLFYVRDIDQGLGYRRLFRYIFGKVYIVDFRNKDLGHNASGLLKHIPKYGRWDDIINIIRAYYDNSDIYISDNRVYDVAFDVILKQIERDVDIIIDEFGSANIKDLSMVGKWLPTLRRHGKNDPIAKMICEHMGLKQKEYRMLLRILRHLTYVVESRISANDWNIEYEKVPAIADHMLARAFDRHDFDNRRSYVHNVLHAERKFQPPHHKFNPADIDELAKHLSSDRYDLIVLDRQAETLTQEQRNEIRSKIRNVLEMYSM